MARIVVDPITRIEGHLGVEAVVTNGKITNAWAKSTMARGLEKMLVGKDPRDAVYVTERVCGVCVGSHAWAGSLAVEKAHGTKQLPELARILRNLILGAAWLHDKPLNFYHLSALDYLDLAALTRYSGSSPYIKKVKELINAGQAGPFLPRYNPDQFSVNDVDLVAHCVESYIKALEMHAKALKMSSLFSGKQPHQSSIIPGGVSYLPDSSKIAAFRELFAEVKDFIENVYIKDVLLLGTGPLFKLACSNVGVGYQNYLSFGGFPEDSTDLNFLMPAGAVVGGKLDQASTNPAHIERNINEDVKHGYYAPTDAGHPYTGTQNFWLGKKGAYTFSKTPLYKRQQMEVGPLARMMVAINRNSPHPSVAKLKELIGKGVQPGAVARHASRALEAQIVVDAIPRWLDQLEARIASGDRTIHDTAHWDPPYVEGRGYGLIEAPRGSLGHWCVVSKYLTQQYAMVVPTTWNVAPRSTRGDLGPVEKALIGCPIPDLNNPINVVRIVHSFDPCVACAVHLIEPESNRRIHVEL